MFSRRKEIYLGEDPLAEVIAIGVLPLYRTSKFVRQTGLKISKDLIEYAASYFRGAGFNRMRMIVDAWNKEALFFYHTLGAHFEPYEQAGEKMIYVWMNLET